MTGAAAILHDQCVLVLGGSSGIGFEIARQAGERGAQLIVAARNRSKLEAAAMQLRNVIEAVVLDAHDHGALRTLFEKVERVDHVVSMIGDSMAGGFLDTPEDVMRQVIYSKYWTNWHIGRLAAGRVRPGGSLTFTSGTGGRAQEISATYVANQSITAMVQGLAVELAPQVRVNAVAPTFMGKSTAFWKHLPPEDIERIEASFIPNVPLQRLATVEEVASTYLHLMTNGFITGQVVAVDGGVMLRK
jgi:NAD(P)-dependent dehydrogenase (short-subunit alcohol dehydrogenase family)